MTIKLLKKQAKEELKNDLNNSFNNTNYRKFSKLEQITSKNIFIFRTIIILIVKEIKKKI